jgi:biotin carboxyl carrier protein
MDVHAEVTGTVSKVQVTVGQEVSAGQVLVIIESMKMEIPVLASAAGVVEAVLVELDGQVKEGDVILRIRS